MTERLQALHEVVTDQFVTADVVGDRRWTETRIFTSTPIRPARPGVLLRGCQTSRDERDLTKPWLNPYMKERPCHGLGGVSNAHG